MPIAIVTGSGGLIGSESVHRDAGAVNRVLARACGSVGLVVHTVAQPSHDRAATDPQTDFSISANGTLNLLEATRRH